MSEVYDFAADPLNLPKWAAGLAGSEVERDGDQWFTESPMGRVTFTFAPQNDFGVLDHDVTLPSGEIVYNPLRVSHQRRRRVRSGLHPPQTSRHDRGGVRA